MSDIITHIKKSILQKKIMLSYLIDSYSRYDKIFKYVHMFFAIISPVVSLIDSNMSSISIVPVILSSLVAAMIKLKDYLKYDKIKELSKQQTVKYEQLFQRILRDTLKFNGIIPEDYLYLINKEYNNIEISDPDIPRYIRDKYIELCKINNIEHDDDLFVLKKISVDCKTESINGKTESINGNVQNIEEHKNIGGKTESINGNVQNIEDKAKNTDKKNSLSYYLDNSEYEQDKQEYKNRIINLNTAEDIKWALEKMENI